MTELEEERRLSRIMTECWRTAWQVWDEDMKDAMGVPRLKPTTTRIPMWGEQGDTDGR